MVRSDRLKFGVALLAAIALTAEASAQMIGAAEADRLVRAQWFEGLPDALLAPLDVEAVTHLEDILNDAADEAAHAPAIELLGRAGGLSAFDVVIAYAADAPGGDVSAAGRRARFAILIALGHFARTDDRALLRLSDRARGVVEGAAWWSGRFDSSRIALLERQIAIAGLGLSGRREARDVLHTLASPSARAKPGDKDSRPQIAAALEANARVAADEAAQ